MIQWKLLTETAKDVDEINVEADETAKLVCR